MPEQYVQRAGGSHAGRVTDQPYRKRRRPATNSDRAQSTVEFIEHAVDLPFASSPSATVDAPVENEEWATRANGLACGTVTARTLPPAKPPTHATSSATCGPSPSGRPSADPGDYAVAASAAAGASA